MNCPVCQRSNPEHARYCCHCGQRLRICEACEVVFGDDAEFCGRCGGSLRSAAHAPFTPPATISDPVRGYLYDPDDHARHFELTDGHNTIGAGDSNDIVIDHPAVSWNHAVVICRDDKTLLQDSASTNGTFVQGERIDVPTRIDTDTEVRFGQCTLRVWLRPR